MVVHSARLIFSIPYAQSLKDKRQVRRSLIDRARHRFNAAIAEVGSQDAHQTLTLGIAVVSGDERHAQAELDTIIRFLESGDDAQLISIEMD